MARGPGRDSRPGGAGAEALPGVLLPSPWTLVPRQEVPVGKVPQASMMAFCVGHRRTHAMSSLIHPSATDASAFA
jgi:hypothetical protein